MRGSATGRIPSVFVQVGQRFERLTVTQLGVKVGVSPSKPAGWRAAICQCDCGAEALVKVSDLVSGKKRSCGCLKREAAWLVLARHDGTKHGMWGHPLYDAWYSMVCRCHDPRNVAYARYGGRGIRVHEPWRDPAVFIADIEASIGPRPEGKHPSGKPLHTLDRIDNDGHYEPGNVRWATATEQQANTGRAGPSECSVDGCQRIARSCGMCGMHYKQQWRRNRRQAA